MQLGTGAFWRTRRMGRAASARRIRWSLPAYALRAAGIVGSGWSGRLGDPALLRGQRNHQSQPTGYRCERIASGTRILFVLSMGRPNFLVGGLLLHWLGVAMALASGASLRLPALLWGQAAVTAIQLMTHYCNDYFDLAADLANPTPTHWSGGSRVLPAGCWRRAWRCGSLSVWDFAIGVALLLAITVQPGVWTLLLFVLALLLAWAIARRRYACIRAAWAN